MTEASWLEPLAESHEDDHALAPPPTGCLSASLAPAACQDHAHTGKVPLPVSFRSLIQGDNLKILIGKKLLKCVMLADLSQGPQANVFHR